MKVTISNNGIELSGREYKILFFGILLGLNIAWLLRHQVVSPYFGVLVLSVTIASLVSSFILSNQRVKSWIGG